MADASIRMSLADPQMVQEALSRRITVDVGLDYSGLDPETKAFMERLMVEIHEHARDRIEEIISIYVGDVVDAEPIQ